MSELETGQINQALVPRSGELAATAAAAKAKAMVEAAYVMAYQRPRSLPKAESSILQACERYEFAETAMWSRPVGSKHEDGKWEKVWGEGLSIRFAEVAIQSMTNLHVSSDIMYEDDEKRVIKTTVLDLESNAAYSKDTTIPKRVERSRLKKDEVAIATRRNADDALVYIVAASDMAMDQKQSRAESILIRTNGLRLIPEYIKAAAIERIKKTLNDAASKDLAGARARVCAALAKFGATDSEIVAFMGKSVQQFTAADITQLRGLYRALEDKQTTWSETIAHIHEAKPEPERGSLNPEDLKPVDPPIDVTPSTPSVSDLWDQYVLDLKKKKVNAEGLTFAKTQMLEEYGLNDVKELDAAGVDPDTFKLYLSRLETLLASEDYLK